MFRVGRPLIDGAPVPAVEADGRVYRLRDLTGATGADLDHLFADWDRSVDAIAAAVTGAGALPVELGEAAFAAPVAQPRKLICIGINYADHIEEMGVGLPEFPYAFLRPPLSLTGHRATVALPDWPRMIDWEAELGVVIGGGGRNLVGPAALAAVAGYTVVNDLSARDWIESAPFVGVDWVMQKAWDAFQPTGPWLTPARFVPDPQALQLELTVNGDVKQRQSTARMVFGVQAIVEHLSRIMTLEPGDVIATGTPAGVGFGRRPREFLAPGDVATVTITSLGTLETRFN